MPPGRPKTTNNEERLRGKLAEALHRLGEKKGLSRTQLAKEAGVTKQSMSLYLDGKATPTTETLRKLCTNLRLPPLDIEGAVISLSDIRSRKARPDPKNDRQLSLSLTEAISTVPQENLHVTVLRRSSRQIDLKVSVKFGPVSTSSRRPKSPAAAAAG
jgi:transcriptional regulator with XRE-family HTH domain